MNKIDLHNGETQLSFTEAKL